MSPLFWAAILLIVGLSLVMAEIFVPSGGIIGFLSFTSIVASIVLAFAKGGGTAGVIFLTIACLAVPMALAAAFRFLPDTPMGKRLLPSIPTTEEVMPDSEQRRWLQQLVGKVGRAKSKMLPSGAVTVDGQTVDAMSQGIPIEPGQAVKIIEVRGAMVVVTPVDEKALGGSRPRDDVLSQGIETLGLDPFEDPLK